MKKLFPIVVACALATSATAHEIGAKCNQTYRHLELAYRQAQRLRSSATNSFRLLRLESAIGNLKRAADTAIKCWRGADVQFESDFIEILLRQMEDESPFLRELRDQ